MAVLQQPANAQDEGQPTSNPNEFGPEKQEQLEKAYQVGRNLIYEPQVFESIVGQVDASEPVQALADTAVMVVDKIEESMGQLPIDVVFALGIVLISEVADTISETGKTQYNDQQTLEALQLATQMYLMRSERDPGEVQAAMQGMQQQQGMAMQQGGM